jgi:hypothetical protein
LTTEFVRQDLAQNSGPAAEPDRERVIREGVASYRRAYQTHKAVSDVSPKASSSASNDSAAVTG